MRFVLAIVIGLIVGLGGSYLRDTHQKSLKRDACEETFADFCGKAFTCDAFDDVKDCDDLISRETICSTGNLPTVEEFDKCTRDLRTMSCKNPLPESCLVLQKIN